MPTQVLEALLARSVILTVLFFGLLLELGRVNSGLASPKASQLGPRPLHPRKSNDCAHCRVAATIPPATPTRRAVPCAQKKSPCGRKKIVDTRGQACPNPDCDYREITDPCAGYTFHPRECEAWVDHNTCDLRQNRN